MMIYNDPPPGMFIVPDKDDMTIVCICSRSLLFISKLKMSVLMFYITHLKQL